MSYVIDKVENINVVRGEEDEYNRSSFRVDNLVVLPLPRLGIYMSLAIISGVAYLKKKNYHVNTYSQAYFYGYRKNNESVYSKYSKFERIKINRFRKKNGNFQTIEEQWAENRVRFDNLLDYYHKYGIHTSIKSPEDILVGEIDVSNTFFRKYFEDVATAFERIRQNNKVIYLANECVKRMYKDSDFSLDVGMKTINVNGSYHNISYHVNSVCQIAYSDIGMSDIDDVNVLLGLQLAIIEKILVETRETNQDVWDLTNVDYRLSHYDTDALGEFCGIIHNEIPLTYLKREVKQYDNW